MIAQLRNTKGLLVDNHRVSLDDNPTKKLEGLLVYNHRAMVVPCMDNKPTRDYVGW